MILLPAHGEHITVIMILLPAHGEHMADTVTEAVREAVVVT